MRFILGLLLVVVARATAGPEPGDPGTPDYEKAAKLVQQLGAARFAEREEAVKQLLELRGSALNAVEAGTRSTDAEVRARCAAIVPKIRAADWKARAEAFLADPAGYTADPKLLAEYEKTVGKLDEGSRKLFAEMVKADIELMALAVARADGIPDLVRKRCKAMMRRADRSHLPVRTTVGQLAAVFFADERGRPERAPWRGDDHPAFQLANPGLADGMAAADTGPALRRLVVHWAAGRPTGDEVSHQFFALAASAGPIPEAVPVLARLAKDADADIQRVRAPAAWALGRIGSPEAQTVLKGLVADRSTVDVGLPKGICTLGDCALAALAQAKGQKPTDLGMVTGGPGPIPLAATSGGRAVHVPVHGFPDEEARQSELKKLKAEAPAKK
jgi:hypothetical protein